MMSGELWTLTICQILHLLNAYPDKNLLTTHTYWQFSSRSEWCTNLNQLFSWSTLSVIVKRIINSNFISRLQPISSQLKILEPCIPRAIHSHYRNIHDFLKPGNPSFKMTYSNMVFMTGNPMRSSKSTFAFCYLSFIAYSPHNPFQSSLWASCQIHWHNNSFENPCLLSEKIPRNVIYNLCTITLKKIQF